MTQIGKFYQTNQQKVKSNPLFVLFQQVKSTQKQPSPLKNSFVNVLLNF